MVQSSLHSSDTTMTIRRSLTPPLGIEIPGTHGMRRTEARRETSERVILRKEGRDLVAWALNSSRGGLRLLIDEERAELGDVVATKIGDVHDFRAGRVVWLQDEPDGMILGIEYLDAKTDFPPRPDDPSALDADLHALKELNANSLKRVPPTAPATVPEGDASAPRTTSAPLDAEEASKEKP